LHASIYELFICIEHCKRASIKRICFKFKFVTASATEEKKGIYFEKRLVASPVCKNRNCAIMREFIAKMF
jgi:hypothetical protein